MSTREPRLAAPPWTARVAAEGHDRAQAWWAENRHRGPDVPVLDGPCAGQRVRLPVVYVKVLYLLPPGSPPRAYHPYQYDHGVQSYRHRGDLDTVPPRCAAWPGRP